MTHLAKNKKFWSAVARDSLLILLFNFLMDINSALLGNGFILSFVQLFSFSLNGIDLLSVSMTNTSFFELVNGKEFDFYWKLICQNEWNLEGKCN